MSIRQRIFLLVMLTLLGLGLVGGYSIWQSQKNSSEVRSVTEGVVPSALASSDMLSKLKDVLLTTRAILAAPDLDAAQKLANRLAEQKNTLQQSLAAQSKEADSEAQKGLVTQLNETLADYYAAVDSTVQFKLQGKDQLAEANYAANAAEYQSNIEQIIETLRIQKNRSKDEAIAQLNANLKQTVSAISIVSLISLIVLGVMGVLLYRQVIRPMSRMQQMMTEVASTQDFSRRLPVTSEDELGRSMRAFNLMIEKIQDGSERLKEKTADINSMLQNLPEGVLTIQQDGTIHPEYSAYLETIYETPQIAGANALDFIFSGSTEGADALAQIAAVFDSSIGEERMNFDFNAHLLPQEIERKRAEGAHQYLALHWSPICDENENIEKIMLSIRDITHLREIEAEAAHQKRELEMIRQIIAVSQEKFHAFVEGSRTFLQENRYLVESNVFDADVLTVLFRNMHTIKGNARTYGLQLLTHSVHEAEQTYDNLRKDPSAVADRELLLTQLTEIGTLLDEYEDVNDNKLGRKGPGRRGNAEKYLMVERTFIKELCDNLADMPPVEERQDILLDKLRSVREQLGRLGTSSIHDVLDPIIQSLPSVARELGKDEPVTSISDNGIRLRNQVSDILRNAFMHLYRNAIDHGIEQPDERAQKGKPTAGHIRLDMFRDEGKLVIQLKDDGKGLALERIRAKALQTGLFTGESDHTDEDIAEQVFASGLSTAEQVSDISGRGVGMDAVRAFIRREGGDIKLKFEDDNVGHAFRSFSTIITLPESYMVI